MADTTTLMTLQVWDQVGDIYDHSQLANNWTKVDQHDHTSGKGKQIPTAGIENGAITSAKIASLAISGSQVADNSITAAKISADAWTPFTPVISGGTLNGGSNTVLGYYTKLGRTVHFRGYVELGSGGSFTSATGFSYSVPFTSAALTQVGSAYAFESGAIDPYHVGVCRIVGSTDTVGFRFEIGSSPTKAPTDVLPFTWGLADTLSWQLTYEAAA